MSVSFEKTGIVRASGEIGENLVIDSANNDDIYTGDTNGFIESGDMMSVYPGLIQTTEFIEW